MGTHETIAFPRRPVEILSPMKLLIIYFSFTSTVHALAQAITSKVKAHCQVTVCRIESQTAHSYWGWLPRSFLPNSQATIKFTTTDLSPYDLIYLGFPKWTFACPPVNEYIQTMTGCQGKKMALFMCHRGFDEERYLNHMIERVSRRGAQVVATLSVKQDVVLKRTYEEVLDSFCRQANSALRDVVRADFQRH